MRIVVQADSTLQTVRQLMKKFGSVNVAPFYFLDKENEPIVVKQEQKLLAYDILHPPKAEHTLPTVYIRYKGQGASQPETRYS